MGHEGVISLANHVANKWCGGVSLATVPLDLAAVIVSSITPRALDGSREQAASVFYLILTWWQDSLISALNSSGVRG